MVSAERRAQGRKLPDPDDATLRVVLTEEARRALSSLPRKEVAALVRSSRARGDSVAPSTISRIVSGMIHPTRRVAARLASVLGRHPMELASGLVDAHPISEWGEQVIYKRGGFRGRVANLLQRLAPFLDENVHFGIPSDPERQFRRLIRSARVAYEYQAFRIELPHGHDQLDDLDFVLSTQMLDSPPLVFDFGILEIRGHELRVYEIWMRRYHVVPLAPTTDAIWVELWNDGRDLPSLVRSRHEVDLGAMPSAESDDGTTVRRMVPASDRPRDAAPVALFPAGGLQTRAPYTRIEIPRDREPAPR